jgi:probable HAF family extracellular repeat protein
MRSRRFALLAILLCTSAAARAFAAASLTPLGFLSNVFPYIEVHGVSGDGSVVVGGSFAYGYGYEAFRWTSDGGMVGLGDLPGGSFYSVVTGVSGDGSVVL